MEVTEWKNMIEEEREQKDMFFLSNYNSPIPFEERKLFEGLDYYPTDPDFPFELTLHEHKKKKMMKIEDTKGNEREFLKWCELRFRAGGKECTLQAYKGTTQDDSLFVHFRDKTSGCETYGAGRCIDLDREKHYTNDGKWILDFNKAYNPWCAYSENYACPFLIRKTGLKCPVHAGEKNYFAKKNKIWR